jgi:hypothetical protein
MGSFRFVGVGPNPRPDFVSASALFPPCLWGVLVVIPYSGHEAHGQNGLERCIIRGLGGILVRIMVFGARTKSHEQRKRLKATLHNLTKQPDLLALLPKNSVLDHF